MGQDAGTGNLVVEGLVKSFGHKAAVRDVSFSMRVGEVVGLLGPNGAGKTTIFYMIVGFIQPNAGRIYLNGGNISGLPMYKRARLGISYLPQEPSVFRKLTVEQNIWAILETRRDLRFARRSDKLDESVCKDLGIRHLRKQKAYTLSGGERRRTEIARSLAIEPQFLLLDEPFAGIDPIAVYEIKRIAVDLSTTWDRGSAHRPQRPGHPGNHPPFVHHQPGRNRRGRSQGRASGKRGRAQDLPRAKSFECRATRTTQTHR